MLKSSLALRAPYLVLLALLLTAGACTEGSSSNGSQDFGGGPGAQPNAVGQPNTAAVKLVRSQVNVRLALNAPSLASTDAAGQRLELRCEALDANGLPLTFLGADGEPVPALPVVLEGAATSLAVQVQVPAGVVPGASGYNLHFVLSPPGAADAQQRREAVRSALPHASHLAAPASDAIRLDAVGSVAAGAPVEFSQVELSVASSLAYTLAQAMAADLDPRTMVATQKDLAGVLSKQQIELEGEVDVSVAHALGNYLGALSAALQDAVLQRPDLQAQAAQALAARLAGTASGSLAAANFASSFSSQVAQMGGNVAVAFAPGSNAGDNALLGVFTAAATEARIRASNTLPGSTSALAPRGVVFVDVDIKDTIGGLVSITPPAVTLGVTGYRVYLGDASRSPASMRLVAQLQGDAASTTLPLGTVVPAGATTVWAESMTNGTSLGFASARLTNRSSYLSNLRAYAGDQQVALRWDGVAGAHHYTIYRTTNDVVTQAQVLASTLVPNFADQTANNDATYTYAVSVSPSSDPSAEGGLSQQISARPAATSGPAKVQGVKAYASVEDVMVTWPGVPNVNRYRLVRTKLQSNEQPQMLSAEAQPGYVDREGLQYGVDYAYTVAAVDENGLTAAPSLAALASLALEPPALDCSAATSCRVTFLPTVDHFEYYRSATLPVRAQADTYVGKSSASLFSVEPPPSGVHYYAVLGVDANGVKSVLSVPEGLAASGTYPNDYAPALVAWGTASSADVAQGSIKATLNQAPVGVTVDNHDTLLFSEPLSNRVHGQLRLRTVYGGDDVGQNHFILGQPDVTSDAPGHTLFGLSRPTALNTDRLGDLFTVQVADTNNARVVFYDNRSALRGQQPGYSLLGGIGQSGVGAGVDGVATASAFVGLSGTAAGRQHYVAVDAAANRVLLFDHFPSGPQQQADVVLGQRNFTDAAPNAAGEVNACSLFRPSSAWTDGDRLIVYDAGNARVLIWNAMPTSNFAPADVVIGQPDMQSSTSHEGPNVSAEGLAALGDADVGGGLDSDGVKLVVADTRNHRVLLYQNIPVDNGAPADTVLGQPDMVNGAAAANPGARDLVSPAGVALYGHNHVVVTDSGNRRVLLY